MKTSSRLLWWQSLGVRWRVVKSCASLFTSHILSVYRGFRRFGEEWRVKTEVAFLQAETPQHTAGKYTSEVRDNLVETYLPTYRFVPGNGTKLPWLRAILCHCQAKIRIRLFQSTQITIFWPNVLCRGGILCSLAGIFSTLEVVTFHLEVVNFHPWGRNLSPKSEIGISPFYFRESFSFLFGRK